MPNVKETALGVMLVAAVLLGCSLCSKSAKSESGRDDLTDCTNRKCRTPGKTSVGLRSIGYDYVCVCVELPEAP